MFYTNVSIPPGEVKGYSTEVMYFLIEKSYSTSEQGLKD